MNRTFLTRRLIKEWLNRIVLGDDFIAKHGRAVGIKVDPFYDEKYDELGDCVFGTYRMRDGSIKVVEVRQFVDTDRYPTKSDLSILVRPQTKDEET